MHWLPGRPLVAGRWRRVLPRRLWAFTAAHWLPRSPLSSLPGRCRAFCYSHAPLIIQATAMTSCSTTRHSTRIRSPSGADEGWWRSFATCEKRATQDRRTCPPGFMISLSLAILPTGAQRAVKDQCQGARRASCVTHRRRALVGDLCTVQRWITIIHTSKAKINIAITIIIGSHTPRCNMWCLYIRVL
jgi:hypothetical protein